MQRVCLLAIGVCIWRLSTTDVPRSAIVTTRGQLNEFQNSQPILCYDHKMCRAGL